MPPSFCATVVPANAPCCGHDWGDGGGYNTLDNEETLTRGERIARTQRRQSSMHRRLPEPPLATMRSRSPSAFSSAVKLFLRLARLKIYFQAIIQYVRSLHRFGASWVHALTTESAKNSGQQSQMLADPGAWAVARSLYRVNADIPKASSCLHHGGLLFVSTFHIPDSFMTSYSTLFWRFFEANSGIIFQKDSFLMLFRLASGNLGLGQVCLNPAKIYELVFNNTNS